ncbi:3'-5' exonuclease [Vallitalea okinawensis]|uniref:3'-5' exonuclease n=1 Tax=Vallitalea okinawensis TaxID=2078660 RepID=UPI000CFB3C38|nr:3'-5' exonuclease [Vallitalea okinawensis]
MQSYVVLDIETTGTSPIYDKITEIGAVRILDGRVVEKYEQLINPGVIISDRITEITGITNEMVEGQPVIGEVLKGFVDFCGDEPIVGHNVMFDYRFLKNNAINNQLDFDRMGLDTLAIARKVLRHLHSRSLESLCRYYDIGREREHRAFDDAFATYKLLELMRREYCNDDPHLFVPQQLLYKPVKMSPITDKQLRYLKYLINYHQIEPDFIPDKLTKNEASKIIDEIIFKYGRKIGS